MSATMARQRGRVQSEQSNMRLAMNVAKMAKEGFSCATIQETQFLVKKPRAEVQEEKKGGVEFCAHRKVKAVVERHPAMLHQNQTAGCLPCQNGTAKNPQTQLRRQGTGAPPPDRHRQPTPEATQPPPETPPAPSGHSSRAQRPNLSICRPDMRIHTHLLAVLNSLRWMLLPRIASTIQISIQICWLMKEHPLVSTLSAVW